jgi:hypothetical protein
MALFNKIEKKLTAKGAKIRDPLIIQDSTDQNLTN